MQKKVNEFILLNNFTRDKVQFIFQFYLPPFQLNTFVQEQRILMNMLKNT
jgi:hypothetical protein